MRCSRSDCGGNHQPRVFEPKVQLQHPEFSGEKVIASRFRTRMCRNTLLRPDRPCPYEDRCMFAHSIDQLRTAAQNVADGLTSEEAIRELKRKEQQERLRDKIIQRSSPPRPPLVIWPGATGPAITHSAPTPKVNPIIPSSIEPQLTIHAFDATVNLQDLKLVPDPNGNQPLLQLMPTDCNSLRRPSQSSDGATTDDAYRSLSTESFPFTLLSESNYDQSKSKSPKTEIVEASITQSMHLMPRPTSVTERSQTNSARSLEVQPIPIAPDSICGLRLPATTLFGMPQQQLQQAEVNFSARVERNEGLVQSAAPRSEVAASQLRSKLHHNRTVPQTHTWNPYAWKALEM
jgi:hypothetical protein